MKTSKTIKDTAKTTNIQLLGEQVKVSIITDGQCADLVTKTDFRPTIDGIHTEHGYQRINRQYVKHASVIGYEEYVCYARSYRLIHHMAGLTDLIDTHIESAYQTITYGELRDMAYAAYARSAKSCGDVNTLAAYAIASGWYAIADFDTATTCTENAAAEAIRIMDATCFAIAQALAPVESVETTETETIEPEQVAEPETLTITTERQHIDSIGAFVYIDVDGTYAYQDMCGYRTYKTLRGLNKYVQGEAKMANRKAPEIVEATEATTQQVAADAAKQPTKSVKAPTTTEEEHWRKVGEATAEGRITTFADMDEAIAGVDNLIAWEYEDCPDDYDLRGIAEAITCERCFRLALLPIYDDLSDQFNAYALWQVVESHYIGGDDPTDPTDPTDATTDEATDEDTDEDTDDTTTYTTDQLAEALEAAGLKRWTKGSMDRMYANPSTYGVAFDYYKTGNIRSCTITIDGNEVRVSNAEGSRFKATKAYVDLADASVHVKTATDYEEHIAATLEAIVADAIATIAATKDNDEPAEAIEVEHSSGHVQVTNAETAASIGFTLAEAYDFIVARMAKASAIRVTWRRGDEVVAETRTDREPSDGTDADAEMARANACTAATNNTVGWMHDMCAWDNDKTKCLHSVTFMNDVRLHIVREFDSYRDACGHDFDDLLTTEIDAMLAEVTESYTKSVATTLDEAEDTDATMADVADEGTDYEAEWRAKHPHTTTATVWVTSYGAVCAMPARSLPVGIVTVCTGGATETVIDKVVSKSGKTVTLTVRGEGGTVSTRRRNAETMVAVRGHRINRSVWHIDWPTEADEDATGPDAPVVAACDAKTARLTVTTPTTPDEATDSKDIDVADDVEVWATTPIGWLDRDGGTINVWATDHASAYMVTNDCTWPHSCDVLYTVHADSDEQAVASAAEAFDACGFLAIDGEKLAYLTGAEFDQRTIAYDEMADVWRALELDNASALRVQLMRNSVVYFMGQLRDSALDEATRERYRVTTSAVTCALDYLAHTIDRLDADEDGDSATVMVDEAGEVVDDGGVLVDADGNIADERDDGVTDEMRGVLDLLEAMIDEYQAQEAKYDADGDWMAAFTYHAQAYAIDSAISRIMTRLVA